jgi:hypothetical protein
MTVPGSRDLKVEDADDSHFAATGDQRLARIDAAPLRHRGGADRGSGVQDPADGAEQ